MAAGSLLLLLCSCFLHGDPPSSAMSMLFAANRLPIFHFRSFFVNRYPSVTPG